MFAELINKIKEEIYEYPQWGYVYSCVEYTGDSSIESVGIRVVHDKYGIWRLWLYLYFNRTETRLACYLTHPLFQSHNLQEIADWIETEDAVNEISRGVCVIKEKYDTLHFNYKKSDIQDGRAKYFIIRVNNNGEHEVNENAYDNLDDAVRQLDLNYCMRQESLVLPVSDMPSYCFIVEAFKGNDKLGGQRFKWESNSSKRTDFTYGGNNLHVLPSRFTGSTISEIAKTDEGIVVLKKDGDIAMLPKVYDYTDTDRSLIYCMVVAMLDLGVVSEEDVKSFMDTNDQSKSKGILCSLFRLPDLTGDRYPWDGYSMCNPDPIYKVAREIVRPFLKESSVYYYDSAYEDITAKDLCEEVYENKGLHIISVYSEKFNACSLLCLNKLVKPDHVILYCWNPLEETIDGLSYNCVLDVKNMETSIITYKSQHSGYQSNDIHLDTSIYLVKE